MKRHAFAFGLATSAVLATLPATASDFTCTAPFAKCAAMSFTTTRTKKPVTVNLRAGYVAEAANVPFRGNILFYQGLADSIRNHRPFFTRLSAEGYRVIAFDYPGQGGSSGRMSDTRIVDIEKMGGKAWDLYARDKAGAQKTVIGWSTGGLAAYAAAHSKLIDRAILIAPGIAANNVYWITEKTLTSASPYAKGKNPHLDPISPRSPTFVMSFSCDLLHTAAAARGEKLKDDTCLNPFAGTEPSKDPAWEIPRSIPGLVLLSDDKDKYVNAAKTRPIVTEHSAFEIEQYAGALHEIDNEKPSIREKAYSDVISFLSRTNK